MEALLAALKFDDQGLLAVTVQVPVRTCIIIPLFIFSKHRVHEAARLLQNIDTGELCMQAWADRNAVSETMQTGLATFYSRSRGERWCKGETSGNYIHVASVHADCDGDSLVYLAQPVGPSCHTGARTCWFRAARPATPATLGADASKSSTPSGAGQEHASAAVQWVGESGSAQGMPLSTLLALEATIAERQRAAETDTSGGKPSWTARLLADEALLCAKVREEAGELTQALEEDEGTERVASEAADLLYHALVLLRAAEVPAEEVLAVLRARFGTSGVAEKAARPAQAAQ